MKKYYLLSYKMPSQLVLADWIDYELTLRVVWFWGWFETIEMTTYRVYDDQNAQTFYDHWDKLIRDKVRLRRKP